MRNRTQIIGFATFIVIAGTALIPVFAQDAPPDNVSERAPLIADRIDSIKTVDADLKRLKSEKADIEDEIADKQKVRDTLQTDLDADVAAIERRGWTWNWGSGALVPLQGDSPKA